MSKLNPNKPIPCALSMWNSQTEIIYKCPSCGQDFRYYGNYEQFCHTCGTKIDWNKVPKHCTKEFKERYDELVYRQYIRRTSAEYINLMYELYSQYKDS